MAVAAPAGWLLVGALGLSAVLGGLLVYALTRSPASSTPSSTGSPTPSLSDSGLCSGAFLTPPDTVVMPGAVPI